ncbi:pyroglutamylated RF-amide peptide receptor [Phaethornis superciliosus]
MVLVPRSSGGPAFASFRASAPAPGPVRFILTCVIIFALALFGIYLVLYVVTRSKALRTVTNILICSLGLSDLLIAFFCVPFTMLQNISSNWLGGGCWGGQSRAGQSRAYCDNVTVKMIFAVVQIIGFFNSICNPTVYAFMNENFKKKFLSAVCFCIVKEDASPTRQLGNSGITMRQQKASVSQRDPADSDKVRREAFSDGNIEVKFWDQPASKRNLKKHLALCSSELTVHSTLGTRQ